MKKVFDNEINCLGTALLDLDLNCYNKFIISSGTSTPIINVNEIKDYLKSNGAKYTRWWGWYFKTEEDIPELPEGIETVKILWEPMAKNNEWLKNDDEIKKYIDTLMYDATNSQYVGSIGERIEIEIVIEKIIMLENDLGSSKMYLMRDDCGNAFVWTTASSKDWQTGDRKRIRGTIKAHREYRNDKQTVLNRCNECKK